MKYEFPVIQNLSKVLDAIKDRDEFIVAVKDGDYTVVNYAVAFDDTFPPVVTEHDAIRRECRGMIFKTSTGEILHRRLHKFFNVNEKDETQAHLIDFSQPHTILEKLDGSMITPVVTSEGMRWGTKMGVTDVALPVEEFVVDHPEYVAFAEWCNENHFTCIFEWCSRKQKIVVDYPNDTLVLIAVRHNKTGVYLDYNQMVVFADEYKIPVVKAYPGTAESMQHLIDQTRGLEGAEGFVVRFNDGHMVKVKGEWYMQLHRTKDAIQFEKNVIAMIVCEKADDLKSFMLEDDRKRFEKFEHDFWFGVNDTAHAMHEVFVSNKGKFADKKDYAVNFVQKIMPEHQRKFFYMMWDGKNSFDMLKSFISDNCSTQAKVDEMRWVFNCTWEYAVNDG